MVLCAFVGCSKRSDRESDKDVSFYRIPKIRKDRGPREFELGKRRSAGFVAAISRKDLDLNNLGKYRVCSRHFKSGAPASDLFDETNPDWLPTLNLGHREKCSCSFCRPITSASERYDRAQRREEEQRVRQSVFQRVAETILQETVDTTVESEVKEMLEEIEVINNSSVNIVEQFIVEFVDSCLEQLVKEEMHGEIVRLAEGMCNCSTEIKSLQDELAACHSKIDDLTLQLKQSSRPFGSEEMLDSDEKVLKLTGLPNIVILKAIFEHVAATLPAEGNAKLSLFQQFTCTLMKLKLNCPEHLLAFLFSVSSTTISRVLLKWLVQMDIRLQDLIIWPERDCLQKTMPECFLQSFGKKVVVIIDCFKIFIERPSNLQARTSTWSNYKHKNTVKILIGILPQGIVGFISEAWGGRVSDKYLTEHCGILRKLLPGDVILADRGFDISESVGAMRATLHIPAFTRGKSQLSALEVEETRKIANVRIHVERVIGVVQQKYTILQSTLPIHYLMKRQGEDVPLIDRMVRVCCALTNCCDSVVPFD